MKFRVDPGMTNEEIANQLVVHNGSEGEKYKDGVFYVLIGSEDESRAIGRRDSGEILFLENHPDNEDIIEDAKKLFAVIAA